MEDGVVSRRAWKVLAAVPVVLLAALMAWLALLPTQKPVLIGATVIRVSPEDAQYTLCTATVIQEADGRIGQDVRAAQEALRQAGDDIAAVLIGASLRLAEEACPGALPKWGCADS